MEFCRIIPIPSLKIISKKGEMKIKNIVIWAIAFHGGYCQRAKSIYCRDGGER